MRKNQIGQVYLYVLIILAIGSLLVIPLLQLTFSASRLSTTATRSAVAIYALDGANEYIMWKLFHQDWASDFITSGQVGTINITNCGTEILAKQLDRFDE